MNGDRLTPDRVRTLLQGRVNSVPTPFLADGSIDWDGAANIVEVGVSAGCSTTLLTAGDSRLFYLTEDEVARLTRFVIERAAGRTLTVAATGTWATAQAAQFAEFARDAGADVLMSLPPQGAQSPDGLAGHYRALARVMPVMVVGMPPFAALEPLTGEPNICCFKEDGTEAYAVELLRKHGGRWKIMTGGGLARHLVEWPYGCTAYMDWSASCAPHVGARFQEALDRGDARAAARVVTAFERPLFGLAGEGVSADPSPGFPEGWQGLWRAVLELSGVARRFLRPPQASPTEADLERVQPVLERIGLLGAC